MTTIFDEARCAAITRRVMKDASRVPVSLRVADAWFVASVIGMASKHPSLDRQHQNELRDVQRVLRLAIVARYPAARALVNDSQRYSEQAFIARAVPFMADEQPLVGALSMRQLWLLVGALQLAVTHPRCPRRDHIAAVGRQVQARIVAAYPDAAELLELGWRA